MVTNLIRGFREEYPVKVYQLATILLAITATWAVGIFGVVSYLGQQEEEYDRDQVSRCEVSAEARRDLRGVIIGIYNVIEEQGPSETIARLRRELDLTYPSRSVADCLEDFEQRNIPN